MSGVHQALHRTAQKSAPPVNLVVGPQQEKRMARISTSEKVPKEMQDTFNAIVALTDTVCTAHLDQEYAHLARQTTAALCRQCPSPLAMGRVRLTGGDLAVVPSVG
jgi:hypothetical protein